MADVHRRKVREPVEGLTDLARNPEVTKAIRALVDRIVLTPDLRPGKKRATLVSDLEGALAAILHPAVSAKAAAVGQEIAATAPQSARREREHTTSPSSSANNLTVSSEKLPVLSDGDLSGGTSILVAGAGSGHWLQSSRAYDLYD
jgi:hypothetical protein